MNERHIQAINYSQTQSKEAQVLARASERAKKEKENQADSTADGLILKIDQCAHRPEDEKNLNILNWCRSRLATFAAGSELPTWLLLLSLALSSARLS